jgi:hypothetical protein
MLTCRQADYPIERKYKTISLIPAHYENDVFLMKKEEL